MNNQSPKIKHLMYCPWTGLGLYNGFRGNRWLKNRIQVFKQFVIPSLQSQTSKNFILWCSWRPEEKNNPHVKELVKWLNTTGIVSVHTYHGVCFYDDKYEDSVARERLVNSLHYTMGDLHDVVGDSDYVLMTIQPSDDLYDMHAIETLQYMCKNEDWQAIGFKKGYIIKYQTKEIAEYNPTTNPPFYTIKFPAKVFLDPLKHIEYTSLKKDVGKYKKGTALPSHEYVGDCLKYCQIDERGFMVGIHGENISTTWQIPFKGRLVEGDSLSGNSQRDLVLQDFGIYDIKPLKIRVPAPKRFYFSLPYKAQRKIRYWITEKFKFKSPRFFRTTKTHANYWKNRKIDWRKDYLSTWNHPHRQVIKNLLLGMPWMSLMEIGCGAGANLAQIAVGIQNRKFQLGGTDINAEAIEVAKNNGFFKDGNFLVCPNDDVMMSDKSTDVVLSDMSLIYMDQRKIHKTLKEFKRIGRNWLVMCEFDSTKWWKRWWVKSISGYNVYDYKKLLDTHGFYDIIKYKLTNQDWPGSEGTYQEGLRYIIIARIPKYI